MVRLDFEKVFDKLVLLNKPKMNKRRIEEKLVDLPIGGVYFFPSVGSTNDVALQLLGDGVDDFTLVIADAQTEGKGRSGRRWFSYPGTCLAFSLILRPKGIELNESFSIIPRYTGLGALAVCKVLREQYSLHAQIKWPNDVLMDNRKCCGILVEAQWSGEHLSGIVLGIGINVTREAIPVSEKLRMMATSVEVAMDAKVDRLDLLYSILIEIMSWRSKLHEPVFIQAWESNLAFLGKKVVVVENQQRRRKGDCCVVATISGLESDGALRLTTLDGENMVVHNGEILHPLENEIGLER